MDVHLVIPAFRESERLPVYLDDLVGRLAAMPYRATVTIVDDGSGADEQDRLRRIVDAHAGGAVTVRGLYLPKNRGKGHAVRQGWAAEPQAAWLAFADADGATPASEVVRVVMQAIDAADARRCYFGSRVRMLGRTVGRRWTRHVLGRIYATFVALLIREGVYDSQCGFKILPREAFQRIAPLLREDRFAFDCELIVALSGADYELIEVPIDWIDVPGSRVSLVRDPVRMIASVFRIRARLRRGAFRTSAADPRPAAGAADPAAR